ncbi:MAG: hypothetical protein ACRDDZ_06190 [Marinifilaceae bacterium]
MNESIEFELLMRDKTREGLDSVLSGMDSIESGVNGQIQTIERLEAKLQDLQVQYNQAMSASGGERIAQLEQLEKQIVDVKGQMEALNQVASKPIPPVADQTAKKFNMLNFQVQQVARELPAIAMGPQMFFLAISNNLPMLTDEIKRAKTEYKELLAQGKQGTPVWKQVLKSIVSWQTALVVGITLLVAYGREITAWVKSLVGAKEALEVNIETMDAFNEKVSEMASKAIASFLMLQKQYNALGDDLKKKKQFIDDNKEAFDELGIALSGVVDADKLFVDQSDDFVNAMILRAKSAAAMEMASEVYKKSIDKMLKADQMSDTKKYVVANGMYGGITEYTVANKKKFNLIDEAEILDKEARKIVEKSLEFQKEYDSIIEKLGLQASDEIIEGSVGAIEKAISLKRESLKKLTNKADYDAAMKEVMILEKQLESITGAKEKKSIEDKQSDYRLNAEAKLQEQIIALMEEGRAKKRAILEQEYNDEIRSINDTERKYIEHYKKLAKAGISVNPEDIKRMMQIFENQRSNAGQIKASSLTQLDNDEINALVKQYQDYIDKRAAIDKKYRDDIKLLNEANENGRYDRNIAQAEKQRREELAKLDRQAQGTTGTIGKLFADMSRKSVAEMKLIVLEVEALLDYISGGTYDTNNVFGITQEQFEMLRDTPESIKAIKDELYNLRLEIKQTESGLSKITSGFKAIFSGEGNLDENLNDICAGLSDINVLTDLFASSLANLGELTGNDTFGQIADGISQVMDVTNEMMAGAQAGVAIGGPIGAAVGAGLGLISGVTKILAENKKHRAELRKQIADNNMEAYLGEMEINQLYRERYEWTKKIGESTLTNITRQGAELKKQANANAKEQEELLAKLYGMEYKSGERFKKTGLFGWGKGKIVEEWSSLSGKSFEEIELLASQGKLSEEGQKYFEALKKAREEGEDLAARQEEYLESVRETFTGTSYSQFVDGIVEGFKQGKRSAADFAESFEELMKGAVLSAVALMAEDEARGFYERYANLASDADGLTQADIDSLKKEYQALLERIAQRGKEIEEIAGISVVDNNVSQSGKAGAFTTMSQETGTKLEGLFLSVQMHLVNIDDNVVNAGKTLGDILDLLNRLVINTAPISSIAKNIEKIRSEGIKMK